MSEQAEVSPGHRRIGPQRSPRVRSDLLSEAYALAALAHADQLRDADARPYVEHVRAVGSLLAQAGLPDEVVVAGILHDSVEKSDISPEQVRDRFGTRVARLVAALTQPADIPDYAARKRVLREQIMREGADAEAIFAADKLDSVSSLLGVSDRLGVRALRARLPQPLEERIAHYEATLALLEQAPHTPPFLGRLRTQLAKLTRAERSDHALALAERAADAINHLDPAALATLCTSDVEWWSAFTLSGRDVPYRGHDGLRRYMNDLARAWAELRIEIQEHRQMEEQHIAICDVTAYARASNRVVAQQSALVYSLRERLIATATGYLDAADAVVMAAVAPGRGSTWTAAAGRWP